MDCRSIASSTVGVCSTARRKRNHIVNGIWRAVCGGRSPRSRAINPKPPLSSSRSAARSSCSKHFCGELSPQRTHSNRSNSTPAAVADCGSRVSLASTTTQHSPRRVAAASAASSNVVRPEEAGPQISVRQPRGRPPVSASISAMPLETISGAGRTANREAGVTPASLASLNVPGMNTPVEMAGTTRCGGRPSATSSSKAKGRPWAAEVETTAEDIDSSENFREHRRLEATGGNFAFSSPFRIVRPAAEIVKPRREGQPKKAGPLSEILGKHDRLRSPHSASVRPDHLLTSLAAKSLGKLRHV